MPTAATRRLVPLLDVPAEPGYERLTVRHLRRLVYDGRIPRFKLGGRVWLDLDDLDRYIEASRIPAAS